MAKQAPAGPSDWRQIREDIRKSLKPMYALSREKTKGFYTLLKEALKQWKLARKATSIISHWHKLFEDFQESPQRIYILLEGAIEKRKIPDVQVSRINYPEAGVLSAKREYLRVSRKEHIFDICAAPFGTGFFISWWLGKKQRFLGLLALLIIVLFLIVGFIIRLPWWLSLGMGIAVAGLWGLSLRLTYYRLDTALMFQDSVHLAVLEVIERVTQGKGVRALSELEKKPIMSDLFKRMVK